MTARRMKTSCPLVALALGLAGLMGCSSEVKVYNSPQDNLFRVYTAYNDATQKLGHPPRNMQELKQFLPQDCQESALISPADNQPYVILWGVNPMNSSPPLIIAYEKQGKDGSRYVFASGPRGVELMSDADFAKARFPGGHRPQ